MDIRQAGTLTFTLTPGNNSEDNTKFITDDLDFAVWAAKWYRQLCQQKLLRCMAAGANTLANGGCTAEPVGQLQRD